MLVGSGGRGVGVSSIKRLRGLGFSAGVSVPTPGGVISLPASLNVRLQPDYLATQREFARCPLTWCRQAPTFPSADRHLDPTVITSQRPLPTLATPGTSRSRFTIPLLYGRARIVIKVVCDNVSFAPDSED